MDSPPASAARRSIPPEIKPRTSSRSNSITSPTKNAHAVPPKPVKPSPEHTKQAPPPVEAFREEFEKPEKLRKKSVDLELINTAPPIPKYPDLGGLRRHSDESKDTISITSPAAISSSPSHGASLSSGPSSPIHTEDEKQENESNEKTDINEEPVENGKCFAVCPFSFTSLGAFDIHERSHIAHNPFIV